MKKTIQLDELKIFLPETGKSKVKVLVAAALQTKNIFK